MKTRSVSLALLTGALFLAGFLASTPQAFHSGGVAECGGCHSMHSPSPDGTFLLIKSDASSTCLDCHSGPTLSSYHVYTFPEPAAGSPPVNRTPGGEFTWLKKTYTFTVRGTATTEKGETHGHNVVAEDFGFVADTTNTVAPGGSFSAAQLGCQSCHDPHSSARRKADGTYATGQTLGGTADPISASGSYNSASSVTPAAGTSVGVYRLLRGLGDDTQGPTFEGVAIAIAPSTYNVSEAATQVRVAYGHDGANTWGNWCASCHPDMHSDDNYVHPIDEPLEDVARLYNYYVKSGDMSGNSGTSYSSLVPFVEDTGNITTLASHANNNNSYRNGPSTSDRVSCVSCHRAHASDFPEMLRWNMENEFMVRGGVYQTESRGRSTAEAAAGYYDRPVTAFASYQRVLCNKCHAKD